MDLLKLAALDEEDLSVISAYLQDAVAKTGEITFTKQKKRLAILLRRFVWEKENGGLFRRPLHERRLASISFDRVLAVRSTGIDRNKPDEVLSLLAVRFLPGEAPSGTIELVLSGGATIHLDVECIEVRLTDLGAAWETPAKPQHNV